ncbi:MAG: hypothetical protein OXN17_08245 [Candidatus Poribacteria bacterium]|nr:hypothetical protein [Candidatus Poribacteria bacterium]MDE0505617.1 hypothetical protein [Candidatus Poribacteria bacterium]
MVNSKFHGYKHEWDDRIDAPEQYNCRIEALIPNLKHRPERWARCRKLLEEQGFPRTRIHRFNAFSWKDYATAEEALEHAREFIRPMPRLISASHHIRKKDVSGLCWLLTWYSIMLRISRFKRRNLYGFLLVDDCFTVFTYAQLLQILHYTGRYEHHNPRIVQISQNSRVLVHRRVVPYFDILQYGLCGRSDAGSLLNRDGARDVLAACELFPREQILAYFYEKITGFPQQQGYFSLSALYESGHYGGTGLFAWRPETQDRQASKGYK